MCSVYFCNELFKHHEQDLVDDEEIWKLFRGDSALSDPIDDLLLDPAQSESAQKTIERALRVGSGLFLHTKSQGKK